MNAFADRAEKIAPIERRDHMRVLAARQPRPAFQPRRLQQFADQERGVAHRREVDGLVEVEIEDVEISQCSRREKRLRTISWRPATGRQLLIFDALLALAVDLMKAHGRVPLPGMTRMGSARCGMLRSCRDGGPGERLLSRGV
ncbi:hypothetical protein GJ654_13850 [Rhodoblastus acidophilus]|uniref:Uncharacterized protein n=1 Tax=Rhodoblastus acidophilus TaxID=1074 RepID=A0A6N8DNL6_RHOAC|nr:hypothetical protein [Rhodoblastus acidophilus]MCW2275571.1 hypothetical protein [Rhodoblastus acidophilus]MTV32069.1 hypothetical protein [Rhodoblastus acidophilus]